MQQHPIPQNVTQYQFRLVGDMTLKQFLELAGGLLLAYLFYASNLIFIFKWPLALLSILGGIGLAFFPLEDRPLDMWIINFIKAIYAPTRFIWKKSNKVPGLFVFTTRPLAPVTTITKTIKAPVLTPKEPTVPDLSELETKQVSSVDALFSALPVTSGAPSAPAPTQVEVERPTIAVRKLRPAVVVPTTPITTIQKTETKGPLPSPVPTPLPHVVFQAPSAPRAEARPNLAVAKSISLPASPKVPNLVTGVVVDTAGKLVENAIVQIVESGGIPARAMKTNSLGQFYTSTPLSPGTYVIEVEKAGLTFAPQQIVINNKVFSPIELHANA